MESRERVYRTLRFENPDRVPRDLWAVPGVEMFRSDELNWVAERFPTDITVPTSSTQKVVTAQSYFGEEVTDNAIVFKYGKSKRLSGVAFKVGKNIDEWGCEWQVGEDGVAGEVKRPPLTDWSLLDSFTAPWELINEADWSIVDQFCENTDKFVITPWHVDPFERMQFLRGTEDLYRDIAYGSKEVLKLRDMVHAFFVKEIEYWCKTKVDGIRFSDDWGMQTGLLISPKTWRELFKPIYLEYCQMAHAAGKFVFYHSDGNISAIMPDLIEMGVDAVICSSFAWI
jgi:uroporphyrinogen decarboxylase